MSFQKKVYYIIQEYVPLAFIPFVLRLAVRFRFILNGQKALLQRNSALKNSALGKDAFILATGPSLKGVDLSFLAGQDCFSVSNFFLHSQVNLLSPKFHFFAPYHEPLILQEYISWMQRADNELPKSTAIVLGLQTRSMVEQYGIFKGRDVFYLCLEKSPLSNSVVDITSPVLAPQTSPVMVLPVLYYMGYSRVFLLGCDHNILKDYGGVVENFYSPDQDPRKNATSGENWKDGIIKHLDNAKNVFLQYSYYDGLFRKTGRVIKHTSKYGWLDFIEYVPLNKDDIFKAEK